MAYSYTTNPYQAPAYTYNPSGYNPPPYNAYNQTLTAQNVTNNILTIFVEKEQDVTDYPVAAGTTVMLINFKAGKFYLKSTATNGVPQQIRTFDFTEVTQPIQNQTDAVTRSEFDALNAKLDKLLNELGGAS